MKNVFIFGLLFLTACANESRDLSLELSDDSGLEALSVNEPLIPGNGDETSPSYIEDQGQLSLQGEVDQLFAKAQARCGSNFTNGNYAAVIDFSKHSSQKRLFIKNLRTGTIESLVVAHGSGSDRNNDGYAETFSNKNGSNASSLGCYRTAETYHGKNGLSLRIDGLSSTNSNARRRAVVIHGSDYVKSGNAKQGRSWGCPAIPRAVTARIIQELKGGASLYIGD